MKRLSYALALLFALPCPAAIYKNKASQKLPVFAVDATGAGKTGDAANISAQVSKDGGACAASNDVNPTELDATNAPGIYLFDLSQAESNADLIVLTAKSVTSGVVIRPLVVFTEPEVRSVADSAGVTTLLGRILGTLAAGMHSPQSGDSYARLGAPAGASHAADVAAVKAQTAAIDGKTTNLPADPASNTQVNTRLATSGYTVPPSAETIAGQILNTLVPGIFTQGSVGYLIGTQLDTTISSRLAGTSYTAPPSAANNASAVWGAESRSLTDKAGFALTNAYDAAKNAAPPGAKMDLVDAPNAAAIAAFLVGLTGGTNTFAVDAQHQVATAASSGGTGTDPLAAEFPGNYGPGSFGHWIAAQLKGFGGTSYTFTIKSSAGVPIADASVWLTNDAAGTSLAAGAQRTNASGQVTFMLDAGTYYRWVRKTGFNFTNPTAFVVGE